MAERPVSGPERPDFGPQRPISRPKRPAITGISHMSLFADDFAKSQHFYTDLLGWEQVPASRAESGVRFYANHQQYIELVSAPSSGMIDRFDRIGFSTSDAESMRGYLAANGVTVPKSVTTDRDGNRSFEVKDPEGHKIEFTQHLDISVLVGPPYKMPAPFTAWNGN